MALRLYVPKCINFPNKCVFLLFSFSKKSIHFYRHANILCDVSLFLSVFKMLPRSSNVLALLNQLQFLFYNREKRQHTTHHIDFWRQVKNLPCINQSTYCSQSKLCKEMVPAVKYLGQLSLLSSSYCLIFIKARCTIFEIASDFNITIFPSILESLILHTLQTFLILAIWLLKRFFFSKPFNCKKNVFLEF